MEIGNSWHLWEQLYLSIHASGSNALYTTNMKETRNGPSLILLILVQETLERLKKCRRRKTRKDLNYNYNNPPLFPSIPLDHVIIAFVFPSLPLYKSTRVTITQNRDKLGGIVNGQVDLVHIMQNQTTVSNKTSLLYERYTPNVKDKCLLYFKISLVHVTNNSVNALSMCHLVKFHFVLLHQILRIYPLFLSRCIANDKNTRDQK